MREVQGSNSGAVKSAQCRQHLAIVATFLRNRVAQALRREDGPATRNMIWRNNARIMEI